jgi:type I restriction enzyme S subunit
LGDVAEVVSGGTPSTDRIDFWDGDVVWVTPKDLGKPRDVEIFSAERTLTQLGLRSSSARLVPQGTVLLSSRAPIGHLAIAGQSLATNQGFKNIICSRSLNNRFLFHILRGSIDDLVAEGRGNTFAEIPGRVVKDFSIPLPPLQIQIASASFLDAFYRRLAGVQVELPALPEPLEEQRRVVARIEELAAEIHEASGLRRQAADETEAITYSYLNRLFGDIYNNVPGSLSIKRWERLNDVVHDVADGPHITPAYVLDGIPFITVLNITSGRIRFDKHKYITFEDHAAFQRRAKAEPGDVLISKDGTIGVPCYVDTEREFSFFVSVALVKPIREVLDGEFLVWAIRAPYLQDRIRARSRGDMIRHLVLREIRDLTVPVPPPS